MAGQWMTLADSQIYVDSKIILLEKVKEHVCFYNGILN